MLCLDGTVASAWREGLLGLSCLHRKSSALAVSSVRAAACLPIATSIARALPGRLRLRPAGTSTAPAPAPAGLELQLAGHPSHGGLLLRDLTYVKTRRSTHAPKAAWYAAEHGMTGALVRGVTG